MMNLKLYHCLSLSRWCTTTIPDCFVFQTPHPLTLLESKVRINPLKGKTGWK